MRKDEGTLLFSEGQIRLAFLASGIGMVALIVGILILATARPQGRLAAADTAEFERTLAQATDALAEYRETADGRIVVPIERAMELVAARGVVGPLGDIQAASGTTPGTTGGGAAGATSDALPAAGVPTESAPGTTAGEVREGVEPSAQTPSGEAPGVQAPLELPDGGQVYASCAGCHQAQGQGIPGAFPPLAGHAAALAAADRDYLTRVLLYGLQGPIQVDGQSYNGVMPAWPQLDDAEIAAVLNHIVTAWGGAAEGTPEVAPYTADEVAALRGEGLSPADVLALREELELP